MGIMLNKNFVFIDVEGKIYGDAEILSCEQYQRPYQYLSRLSDHTVTLDQYSYMEILGKGADFHELLHIVIRYGKQYCMLVYCFS